VNEYVIERNQIKVKDWGKNHARTSEGADAYAHGNHHCWI